tara:strand:- start:172 stop:369 length:198 start_codon:yes stop_codon:yes gene_type:complete
MSKYRFLSYIQIVKYKEPLKLYIHINTIGNYINIKNKNEIKKQKKNIDLNDIDYSKNFWEKCREI